MAGCSLQVEHTAVDHHALGAGTEGHNRTFSTITGAASCTVGVFDERTFSSGWGKQVHSSAAAACFTLNRRRVLLAAQAAHGMPLNSHSSPSAASTAAHGSAFATHVGNAAVWRSAHSCVAHQQLSGHGMVKAQHSAVLSTKVVCRALARVAVGMSAGFAMRFSPRLGVGLLSYTML